MSSPDDFVIGRQVPELRVSPPKIDWTYGDLACDLCAAYQITPDKWQRLVLDDWLSEVDHRWAAFTCGLSVPRQNGKNVALEIRELFGMIGRGERVLHTAHQVKTAQKHFRRLKFFFGAKVRDPAARFPELNALVTELRSVNGQEAIYLANGGSVEMAARSSGSGRGFTVDTLVCDEAQDMSDDDLEAMLPTISAAPSGNPQVILVGTPPGPKSNGEVFTRTRAEALDAKSSQLSWMEWSAAQGADLDDRRIWAQTNPGLGIRLQHTVVQGERARFADEGFARERLGMWSAAHTTHVISPEAWAAVGDQLSVAVDQIAIAVDVAPDRGLASVATAGQRSDGGWHVELVEQREGTVWLVPYLAKIMQANRNIRAVVVDAASQANTLTDDLARERITVTRCWQREMAMACARFYDGVMDGSLHHTEQPQLTYALSVARKRSLLGGEAWGWNRKSAESDITPIVAVTLALWGAQQAKVERPIRRSSEGRRVVVV